MVGAGGAAAGTVAGELDPARPGGGGTGGIGGIVGVVTGVGAGMTAGPAEVGWAGPPFE